MKRFGLSVLTAISISLPLFSADWPQWMGANRDGLWNETETIDQIPEAGLKKVWSQKISGGYAGPAVTNGKAYVFDFEFTNGEVKNNPSQKIKIAGKERLICLDSKTGDEKWKREFPVQYEVSYPCGPRCTPTVDGDLVYTLGSMGDLNCVKSADGAVVWSKSFMKDFNALCPMWGFSGHPLVYGDLLICLVGGSKDTQVVAFDKKTGEIKWHALNSKEPGYCSPRVIDIAGKKQLVVWMPTEVVGLDPQSGKGLWSYPLTPSYAMSIMAPQQQDDMLFMGGIGKAGAVIRISNDQAKEVWKGNANNAMYPVNMTPIIHKGVVYGCDQPGAFRAVKMETGERLWSTMLPVTGKDTAESNVSSGTAFIVRNNDKFWIFGETGHLILAKLTPEKYLELGRAKLVEPTGEAFGRKVVWSHPAFADGHIFVRNDQEIASYSLKK